MTRRIHSFIWGGIAATAFIALGIALSVSNNDYSNLAFYGVIGIMAFALISCLILKNNFVGNMMLEISSWGFVKLPGLIFTLDLDGLIWLITVKLAFWILGFILALLCEILAVAVGLVVSVFVYPYAIIKNFKNPYDTEDII